MAAHPNPSSADEQTETARLEAFSDGVFAVAITLLALNLSAPALHELHGNYRLINALLAQWPVYLSYALSFLTILIMWINHHRLFQLIRRTDHTFLILNGLLLLIVTTIPFVTSLLSLYLLQPDNKVAELVYSGASLLMATAYNIMWAYASHNNRLLGKDVNAHLVEGVTQQYRFGPYIYLVAFIVAFVNAWLSLGLCILLAIFFALPPSLSQRLIRR